MLAKAFFSLFSFLQALLVLAFGFVCLIFPWSLPMRSALVDFILNNTTAIFLLGFVLFFVGVARIFYILSGLRSTSYILRSGRKAVWIDESIFHDYLENYLKNIFPKGSFSNRVMIKNDKITLYADLPYVPVSEQKELIHKIQYDLGERMAMMLGYKNRFTLSATFQPKPKDKMS